jgi:hypothetical protein
MRYRTIVEGDSIIERLFLPMRRLEMRTAPAPEVMAEMKQEFRRLVEEWKASRGPSSTLRSMSEHPACRAIIGLGEPVIPLVLEELVRDPDWWFSALMAITGANPVHLEDRGNLVKMAESWIKWGRSHGYGFASESCEMVSEAGNDSASHDQSV